MYCPALSIIILYDPTAKFKSMMRASEYMTEEDKAEMDW